MTDTSGRPVTSRRGVLVAIAAVSMVLAFIAGLAAGSARSDDAGARTAAGSPSAPPSPAPSPSPVKLVKVGGVFLNQPHIDHLSNLPPTLQPYPYATPTPPPVTSELDGTYIRAVTFEQIGGVRIGMPYRCLRCIPYRVDAGISTMILVEGAYFVHHHLSGFRTEGNFTLDGDRITFFNDPVCSSTPGVYTWKFERGQLSFQVVDDPCPYKDERAHDVTFAPWSEVPACIRKIDNLWPGEMACG